MWGPKIWEGPSNKGGAKIWGWACPPASLLQTCLSHEPDPLFVPFSIQCHLQLYFTYVVEQLLFFLCTKVVSRGLKKEYLSFSIVFITSFICIGDKVADTKYSIHYHFSVQSMNPSKVLPVYGDMA